MSNEEVIERGRGKAKGESPVKHILRNVSCLLALAFGLAACTVGPDYERPVLAPPDGFKSATDIEAGQPALGLDWWRLFADQELDALVEEALVANLDVQAAVARVAQARASVKSAKSVFYPVVTVGASAARSRTPGVDASSDSATSDLDNVASTISQVSSLVSQLDALAQGNLAGASTGTGTQATAGDVSAGATYANSFRLPFDVSYEIDIWGRIRRSTESAQAQAMAKIYDLEVVRQTLLADLAGNYFNLRSLDAQEEILNQNLALYQEQVELTRQQYMAGLVDETDALQAEVQLESTRAQASDTRRQRADLEHAIAILLGRAPAQFSLEARPLTATPPVIPAGLPSDLLRRRPDVAEAEQNLVAACAEIGVAEAQFYPSVTLTGSAGFQSSELSDLLDWGNAALSFGPSLSLPIFQGGQLRANLEQAKARYAELEAAYRKSVLTAFLDVEDTLTDLHARAEQADARARAIAAAREFRRLTQIQYQTGTVDYMQVINAEQSVLSNEISEIEVRANRMISTVLLIKALGGGWEAAPEAAPAPTAG